MTDNRSLQDAFAEYERRADAYGAAHPAGLIEPARPRRTTAFPLALVAASVVLVLVLAGAIVWLAGGSDGSGGTGGAERNPAAGGSVPTTSAPAPGSVAPTVDAPPKPAPDSSVPASKQVHTTAPSAPIPSRTGARTSATPPPPPPTSRPSVPKNAEQMKRAFRRVLGDEATFVVTQHYGNYLIGTLTAPNGAEGGFDIQAVQGTSGDKATCEDPGAGSHCTVSTPRVGGSLAVERETYPKSSGGGVLFYVNYVFPDGSTFAFHLSNREDPKGAGQIYGPKPPLTLKQMVAIIESDRWAQP